jgi:hypothetical protein
VLVTHAATRTLVVLGPATVLYACGRFGSAAVPGDGGLTEGGADAGWCATHASAEAFCADFDTAKSADEGWSATHYENTDAGTISLSTEHAASGPQSARLSLPAGPGSCRYVELVYRTIQQTTKGHLEFRVWLASPTVTILARFGSLSHCAVDVRAGGESSDVAVELNPSGNSSPLTKFDAPIKPGEWTHVTIDVDFGALSFTASHDEGAPIVQGGLDSTCNGIDFLQANIGIHCEDDQSTEVYIDDVLITPR